MKESFSQFGEDACLQAVFETRAWARYGDKAKIDSGFYVDVGAYAPVDLSNTYWFYKRGWRGITVDPTPGVKEQFDEKRPRDTNLNYFVTNRPGFTDFYCWGKSVYNTSSLEDAERLVREKRVPRPPTTVKVECRTLTSILSKYNRFGGNIDILNVGAEGHNLEVLQSNDWRLYRPEFVLAEFTGRIIEEVLRGEVYQFMRNREYRLFAWTPPTLIFLRNS